MRSMPPEEKSRCGGKLKSYKDEVQNLEKDLVSKNTRCDVYVHNIRLNLSLT